MEPTKKVMSFSEFILESFNQVNEEEGGENKGNVNGALSIITGQIIQKKGEASTMQYASKMIERLNAAFEGYQERGSQFIEAFQKGTDILANSVQKIKIMPGAVAPYSYDQKFRYSVANTVMVKGAPLSKGGKVTPGSINTGDAVEMSISDLLSRIATYNAEVFNKSVESVEGKKLKDFKKIANYQNPVANIKNEEYEPEYKYLILDPESLNSDTIQVVPFEDMKDLSDRETSLNINPKGNPAFQIPIVSLKSYQKGSGATLSIAKVGKVLPPTKKSTQVTNKTYDAQDTSYFEENETVISENGRAQMNYILSQFNSISKIIVNGGASSKRTSREGGNEKLAKDRMEAGINLLNELKEKGVVQLKNAVIEKGKAEVQAEGSSDAKFQQVSFVISGMAKGEDIKNDPVVVTSIEKLKGDLLIFGLYLIEFAIEGAENL